MFRSAKLRILNRKVMNNFDNVILKLLLLVSHISCVQLSPIPWTVARQAPRSMGFARQDTGVGCHFLLQEVNNVEILKAIQRGYYSRVEYSPQPLADIQTLLNRAWPELTEW